MDESVLEETKVTLYARSGSEIIEIPRILFIFWLRHFRTWCVTTHRTFYLPVEVFVIKIDLIPNAKFCVTRKWTLPKKICDVIDDFFRPKHAEGMVKESKYSYNTPHILF